jgi:hypothetical protein
MNNIIKVPGLIHFDAINKTKKHENQSSWKRLALILLDESGELSEYYAWFIKKRYDLVLNKPLRGSHISFINDSINDIKKGLKCTDDEANIIWNSIKNKYDNKPIDIFLDVDVRSSKLHWWLNIPEEYRKSLHDIRAELGLGRPFFGLHMSVGYVNEKYIKHSNYIIDLITKFGNDYN